jgi:glycerol kinase
LSNYTLTIDQGGHASRVIVFDSRGKIVASAHHEIETFTPANNRVEHDPQQLISSIKESLLEVAEQLGPTFSQVSSAGIATQRSSIICWNRKSGEALSPVISWQDTRAQKWLEPFTPHQSEIHAITGLRLSAHYGVSKFQWCLKNLPKVTKAAKDGELILAPLASYLLFKLLDEQPLLVDPANASRTLLYDHQQLEWSPQLLSLFDIKIERLPQPVESWHHYGTLTVGEHSFPLKLSTGDQSAALFSHGMPQRERLYINIGTGAFLQQPSNRYELDNDNLLCSITHQQEGERTYVNEGTVNGAGAALTWVKQQLGLEKKILPLNDWLKQRAEPPLFINAISGLGSPYWRADIKSAFIGEGDVESQVVAVIESILFLLQININLLAAKKSPEQIIISGGLSTTDALCQRLADLSNLPVKRHNEHEATARGLASLLTDQPNWPYPHSTFTPRPNRALQLRFQRWQKAMEQALKVS